MKAGIPMTCDNSGEYFWSMKNNTIVMFTDHENKNANKNLRKVFKQVILDEKVNFPLR